jgi:serine/threonine protein kinase
VPPADPHKTEPGEVSYPTLGGYRLLNLLGEGGMGRVYLAKHLVSGAVFALKVLRPELTIDRSAVRRFITEARVVSSVGHPNVIRIVDVAEPSSAGGTLYYVMEYLTGIDLKRELETGSMPLPRAVGIGVQICGALQAIHDAGVIHRDLKPGNIFLVNQEGKDDLVKVLDFGLAKLESPEPGTTTTTGRLFGTPAYMSPEQGSGRRVDRSSDIYSLGVILYEMFTGRLPFTGSSFGDYVVHHLTTPPLPPSAFSPSSDPLPDAVDKIILRCLEKHPARRYERAADLANDLRQLLPRRTLRPSEAFRPILLRPHRTRLKTIAVSVVGGLVAVAIYALMGSSSKTEQPAIPPVVTPAAPAVPAQTTAQPADLGPSSRAALRPDALQPPPPQRAALGRARRGASPAEEPARPPPRLAPRKQQQDKKNLDHFTMDPF